MLTPVCCTHSLLLSNMVSSLLVSYPIFSALLGANYSKTILVLAELLIQLLVFYSLQLILCPELISDSSDILSAAVTPNSYALSYDCSPLDVCMLSSSPLKQFLIVFPVYVVLWTFFNKKLMHFCNRKFILMMLLIVCTIFISCSKSFSPLFSNFMPSIHIE
jgi:hypothetical protein